MAKYRITGPDGKTYTVSGPDDATEDELVSFVTQQSGQQPKAPIVSKETGLGVLSSIGQGLTFGFEDELSAGIDTALGYNPKSGSYFDYSKFGGRYGANLAAERGALQKFRKERPVTAMASEMAAGVPLGFGAAKAVQPAATMLGRVGQGLGMGGLFGTAYGYGAGEGGIPQRAENAVRTGLVSALVGGGTTAGLEAGSAGIGALRNAVAARAGPHGQESLALRKVAQSIMQDAPDTPPQVAIQRAQEIVRRMGPEAVLADTGENIRMLTGTLYRQGGAPKPVIGGKVIPRQEGVRGPDEVLSGGQYGRVSQQLDDLVPEDALATRTALAKPTEPARELYKEAFGSNRSVDSPAIRRVLNTKSGRKALRMVAEQFDDAMRLVGKPDKEMTALAAELRELGKMADDPTGVGVARGLKLETLDLVKRKIGDLEKQAIRAERSGAQTPGEAKALGNLRRMLTKELDRLDVTARAGPKSFKAEGGAYARARALEQTRLRAKEAFKSGEHFLTKADFRNPKEMQAVLAEMSPEELHALRVSGAGVLKRMAGDVPVDRDITRKLYNTPNLEKKINLLFGDRETFARYIRGMRNEREMFKLYAEIKGGSQTMERLAAEKALQADPGAGAQAAMGILRDPLNPVQWGRSLSQGLGKVITHLGKAPEPVRLEMARALMGRDVSGLMKTMEALGVEESVRKQLAQALMAGTAGSTSERARPPVYQ